LGTTTAVGQTEFQLGTVRAHDQYNTTLYGLDDRYRGVYNGRNIIFINKEDIKDLGLKAHDLVNIHSKYDGVQRSVFEFALIPYDIPRRNLMAYFPEANPLVPVDHAHHETHTPISKNIVVSLESIREAKKS